MTVLSNEQREGVLAQLRGEETPSQPEPQEAHTDESETHEAQEESDYEEEEDDSDSGHAVPYSRFSKVISARNEFAQQAEQSQARIADLEEQLNQLKNLKELFGNQQQEQYDAHSEPEEVSEVDMLRQSLMQVSEQQQQGLIERELGHISEVYPNVPHDMLLQAVIEDPSVDMTELAGTYAAHLAEVEESAIARYLAEQNVDSAQTDVPPEVGHTGGRTQTPGNKSNASSIREVTERLLKEGLF